MINREKLFTVAGTATGPNGVTKVRWANDLVSRVKILNKSGCTDIDLVELPEPMTKLQSLEFLRSRSMSTDAGYAIESKYTEKVRVHKRQLISMTGVQYSTTKRDEPVIDHN